MKKAAFQRFTLPFALPCGVFRSLGLLGLLVLCLLAGCRGAAPKEAPSAFGVEAFFAACRPGRDVGAEHYGALSQTYLFPYYAQREKGPFDPPVPTLTDARQIGDTLYLYYKLVSPAPPAGGPQRAARPPVRRVLAVRLDSNGFTYLSCTAEEEVAEILPNQFDDLLHRYLLPCAPLFGEGDWCGLDQLSPASLPRMALAQHLRVYPGGLDYGLLFGEGYSPVAFPPEWVTPQGDVFLRGGAVEHMRYFFPPLSSSEESPEEQLRRRAGEAYDAARQLYRLNLSDGQPPLLPRITAAARSGDHTVAIWFDLLDASQVGTMDYRTFLSTDPPVVSRKRLVLTPQGGAYRINYRSCVTYGIGADSEGRELVDASLLKNLEPVIKTEDSSVFLLDGRDAGPIPVPYPESSWDRFGLPPQGCFIALRPDEAAGRVIGRYASMPPWQGRGGLVKAGLEEARLYAPGAWQCMNRIGALENGLLYLAEDQSLTFYRGDTLQKSGLRLDFQPPGGDWWFSCAGYDPERREYLLLYDVCVASPARGPDGLYPSATAFPTPTPENTHMEIQRFDSNGKFLGRIRTDAQGEPSGLDPVTRKVLYCRNGVLAVDNGFQLVSCQLDEEKTETYFYHRLFALGEAAALYRIDNTAPRRITCQWFEGGRLTGALTLSRRLDTITMLQEEATVISADETAKRLVVQDGLVRLEFDFSNKTATERFYADRRQLGPPLAVSPDQRYEVFIAGEAMGGEAYFAEYVVYDNRTGTCRFPGIFQTQPSYITAGNDCILESWLYQYQVIDLQANTASSLEELLFPHLPPDERPLILRMKYDLSSGLAAVQVADLFELGSYHRQEGPNAPSYFLIYDEEWNLLRRIESGQPTEWRQGKYSDQIFGCGFELSGGVLSFLDRQIKLTEPPPAGSGRRLPNQGENSLDKSPQGY